MKKHFLFIATILLIGIQVAIAQDYKITTGSVEFQNGEYDKALATFDEALSNPSSLKAKNAAKGFYFRAQARLRVLMTKQQALAKKGMDNLTEEDTKDLEALAKAPLESFADYQKCLEYDEKGKWKSKVDAGQMQLMNPLLVGGQQAIQMAQGGKDPVSGESLTKADQNQALDMGLEYLEAVEKIKPDYYVIYDLKAQAQLTKGDSTTALENFTKAVNLFADEKTKPQNPDQLIAYTYYRMAIIERYKNNNIDAALKAIQDGKDELEAEHKRVKGVEDVDAKTMEQLVTQYENAKQDLNSFELDLYLQAPEKLQEALAKFETAMKDQPNNYMVHVAYANMLENIDEAKAIEIYNKAINVDPKQEIAYFNLGALFNNKAAEYYKKYNETNNEAEADEAKKLGDEFLEKAKNQFANVVKVNPKSLDAVRALKQITVSLGQMEEYTKYKNMESELLGN